MDLKAAQQKKGSNWVVFDVPNRSSIKATHAIEKGVVKSLSGRPQRQRRPPKKFDNSEIYIE